MTETCGRSAAASPGPKSSRSAKDARRGTPAADYNNRYRYRVERLWFDGGVIFASGQGELDIHPEPVNVAQGDH